MTIKTAGAQAYRVAVTWGELRKLPSQVNSATIIAPDPPGRRNAVTFMFTGFSVGLGDAESGSRATTVQSFESTVGLPDELPVDVDGSHLPMEFLGYSHILHGTITKDKDARAVVVVNAGGIVKTIEYPYDVEAGGNETSQLPADFEIPFFTSQILQPKGEPLKYPVAPTYGVQIAIFAERRHASARVLLVIDALEVLAAFASPDGPTANSTGYSSPKSR